MFQPGSFIGNFFTLLAGASIAQLLSILASPVLSRIFRPDDFGSYAVFLSLCAIFLIIATGRYEIAILLPKEDEEALDLAKLAIGLCLAFSLVMLLVLLAFHAPIQTLLKGKRSAAWIYAVPPSIFLMGLYQTLYYWSNRGRCYKRISTSRIIQSAVSPLASAPLGWGGWHVWGLISGQLMSVASGCMALSRGFFRRLGESKHAPRTSGGLRRMASSYSNFPLHNIPAGLLNTLGHQLPIILMGVFFDTTIAGLYFFSYRLINLPLNLVGTSLTDVYYRHSLDFIDDPQRLGEFTERAVAYLLLLAIVPSLVLLAVGGPLFAFFFGARWRTAGTYTQFLIPFFLLRFLSSPLTVFFQKGLTALLLKWQAVFFTASTAALIVGGLVIHRPAVAIALISLVSSICYFWLLCINFRLTGSSLSHLPGAMRRIVLEWINGQKSL